jgi:Fe-S cluster assembly protein SufD
MNMTLTQEKPYVADWAAAFEAAPALPVQAEALEAFQQLGFPDTRHEEWKYTSVLSLLKKGLKPTFGGEARTIQPDEAHLLSGIFGGGSSSQPGLQVSSLKDALRDIGTAATVGTLCPWAEDAFAAANTALFRDGFFADAQKGEHTFHLHHHLSGGIAIQRSLIKVRGGATLTVVMQVHDGSESWLNAVTEAEVEQGGTLNLILVQDNPGTHSYHRVSVHQHSRSLANVWTISLDGGVIRNNLDLVMGGEHAEGHMYGLYLLDGATHVDNHTVADHRVPNCMTNELYKGVLGGSSTGVFNGKIFVRKDAQKTNAYQSNKNILLSPTATINTKPQLEIFADDVKCSHGTTTGRLDETALFYLRARGLSRQGAQSLLTYAFAGEVIEKLPNGTLKAELLAKVASRLGLPTQESVEF